MNQLELHKKIEEFFKAGVASDSISYAQGLLINDDAKRFFFSRADESSLTYLWENGFLAGIDKKSDDPTRYSYRMPELEYLMRMAEKEPATVAKIIDSVKISKENFNPEVIDRFFWIISILPAEQIKTLSTKIKDEKWVYLMRNFRLSGYEFAKTVKKLVEKKENDALLELAQIILVVKNKEEMTEKGNLYSLDDPFYISDLDSSGILIALVNVDDPYTERALKIITDVIADIVKLAEADDSKVFSYADLFSLFDVDFFTLDIDYRNGMSFREDIKNLAATAKKLIERTIGKKCDKTEEVKRLFGYIDKLPPCRSIWRLRLFTLAQCPEAFKEELKKDLFRLFDVDNYYEIEGGTEYKKTLKIAFPYLTKTDQREYVKKVFEFFSNKANENPDQAWHKRVGAQILSSIYKYLEDDEIKRCKTIFGIECNENYEPVPSIGEVRSGFVTHKSPVNLDDYSVIQIASNLKSEWTPKKLDNQFKDDDFFDSRGVEGLGDALKENVKKRTDDYLKNINIFFDRDAIHSHYLYSLLRGVEEILRSKQTFNMVQIDQLFELFDNIEVEGKKSPFARKTEKIWLADWVEVHRVITDILLYILEDQEKRKEIHKAYREKIKNLISYLFTIKDSPSKEDEKPEHGEPYSVAINSVRGRAYEVFVVFTENDGNSLAEDIKKIFQNILTDDSLAVRFVIGRYLASFYFRDKDFITGILAEIFPKEKPDKKDIYLATWEGYLSNTLYDKLFDILKSYYSYAITLDPNDYTQRKYFKNLDELLAIHMALAFTHFNLEITDDLFIQFWSKSNNTRHKEFISFIGRSCLTRDRAGDEWLKENKVIKEKLIKFWDWALVNVNEPEVLSGFGLWINPDKEVLAYSDIIERIAETLKKSDGQIYWDYGLLRRLPKLAEQDGEQTLEIISHYLLDLNNNLNQNRRAPLLYNSEIKDALGIIYKNGNEPLKQEVVDLINNLIEKGSNMFWGLKEIIS